MQPWRRWRRQSRWAGKKMSCVGKLVARGSEKEKSE